MDSPTHASLLAAAALAADFHIRAAGPSVVETGQSERVGELSQMPLVLTRWGLYNHFVILSHPS